MPVHSGTSGMWHGRDYVHIANEVPRIEALVTTRVAMAGQTSGTAC
jgi:hypothetical protein